MAHTTDRRSQRRPLAGAPGKPGPAWWRDLTHNWPLYLMALPSIAAVLVFGYGPLFGLSIAFVDYSPLRGILGSEWVGLKHFEAAFGSPFFLAALRNTIVMQGLMTLVTYPSAIILALLLNEVRVKWYRRAVQTATMLPYFTSWIVAAAIFRNLLAPTNGLVNEVLRQVFGLQEPIIFLSDPTKFRWLMVFQDTWKFSGFFAVIYLASIASIDPALYESAMVDGANRWQQTWHVTLPGIRTTMVTLFVMLTGWLIIGSFEQIFAQYNVNVYDTADILETLTFRIGLQQSRYGLATAMGLFQSVIAVLLVFVTNRVVRSLGQEGLF